MDAKSDVAAIAECDGAVRLPALSPVLKGDAPPGPTKVAFVLSGGGPLGCVQVGVVEALFEHGVFPDMIVGTSVGALNGAWLARNPTIQGIQDLKTIWSSLTADAIFMGSRLRALIRMLLGQHYLYTDKGLRTLITQNLRETTFEELGIPLFVTAVDLGAAELEVFHKGHLIPAILASTAIPGVFPPVSINGHTYIDGGILAHGAVDVAWRNGATHVVLIECPQPPPASAYGILEPISRALWIALLRLRTLGVQQSQLHNPGQMLRLVPAVEVGHYRRSDFSRTPELMRQAKEWAVTYLRLHGGATLSALGKRERREHTEPLQPTEDQGQVRPATEPQVAA